MSDPIRIAMWSGPRNISTAMMRSFENRDDTAVLDEPFYAAYLAATGVDHPRRAETLATQPADPNDVVAQIMAPAPDGRAIFYQKHMMHHMVGGFPLDWTAKFRNAFLIRAPQDVLASYSKKRPDVSLYDIGFVEQRDLFEREADRLGHAPPVLKSRDVLADPRAALTALCAALDIPFSDKMLSWPAGKRDTDGAWAPVWYEAVEKSTGFAAPRDTGPVTLSADLQKLADQARPHYERLEKFKLAVQPSP